MPVEGDNNVNVNATPPSGDVAPPTPPTPPEPPSGDPTPPAHTEPPAPPTADQRVAMLQSLGINSMEDLTDVIELSKLGYAKLKADFDEKNKTTQRTQEQEAEELSKTQFFAKYGGKFDRTKDGKIVVPPDVLHEMFEDNRVEAAKIAKGVLEHESLTAAQQREKLHRDERAAYDAFVQDPKNADLLSGTIYDDDGNPIRAIDEVVRIVNAREMKPSQAAQMIRREMRAAKRVEEQTRAENDRARRSYEGNWAEDIPIDELPEPVREVRPRLVELKKKRPGERGSDSFFDAVEGERRWS